MVYAKLIDNSDIGTNYLATYSQGKRPNVASGDGLAGKGVFNATDTT
jgi:hypothetical protein